MAFPPIRDPQNPSTLPEDEVIQTKSISSWNLRNPFWGSVAAGLILSPIPGRRTESTAEYTSYKSTGLTTESLYWSSQDSTSRDGHFRSQQVDRVAESTSAVYRLVGLFQALGICPPPQRYHQGGSGPPA